MRSVAYLITALFLCFPVTFISGVTQQTSHLSFHVVRNGKNIGILKTSEVVKGTHITRALHSNVRLSMLVEVNITENIADVFENNVLVRSVHTRYVNGKVKSDNTLHRTASGYEILDQDKRQAQMNGVIHRSILSLYYHEPSHGDVVYSQCFMKLLRIERTGAGTYSVELPSGYKTIYYYEKGVLRRVESETMWGTVNFVKG